MPFGEIAASGIPDPDDRQPLDGSLLASRPSGGCEFWIGCYQDAQPFRLARAESIDQMAQILVVRRCGHNQSLRLATPAYRRRPS
jgi:hypothetical protein